MPVENFLCQASHLINICQDIAFLHVDIYFSR